MPQVVRVELEKETGVATVRLDRPKMNAINSDVAEGLLDAARECALNDAIKAVVVYGGDKIFAAGADIKEMAERTSVEMMTRIGFLQQAFTAIEEIPKVTIAAITGFALGGGCELSLCCDFRVFADNAQIGQPEILLGVIPGAGGTQRLTRLVGPARAKEIIFSGRFVGCVEAREIGLVDVVVPADKVYEEAVSMAAKYAQGPTIALRAAKLAINKGANMALADALTFEAEQFAALFATQDQKIGMESFLENGPGKAKFQGK